MGPPYRQDWILCHRGPYHLGHTLYHGSLRLGRCGPTLHGWICVDRISLSKLGLILYRHFVSSSKLTRNTYFY